MKPYPLTKKIQERADRIAIAGEPTRMRILCLLFDHKEACVHEIASALGASIASTSHHLQSLKEHGLLQSTRCGQTICYKLTESEFSKKLKPIVCETQ